MDSMPYRNSRPASAARNQAEAAAPGAKAESEPARPVSRVPHAEKAPKPRKLGLIIAIVVIASLLVFGAWMFMRSGTTASSIDGSRYQAVFFTNGQVYFGKLRVMNEDYSKLTDVFYLQTKTTAKDAKNPQETSAQDASDVELIKLGSEIHGPEDEMVISKDQILFFENLKADGTVSKTIKSYQADKSGGN